MENTPSERQRATRTAARAARIGRVAILVALVAGAGVTVAAAEPEPHVRVMQGLSVTAFVLAGGDIAQTMYCVGAATCREGNPALAPIARHPFVFGATKGGIAAGLAVVAWRVRREHPRIAIVLLSAEVAANSFAVVRNARTLARDAR